MSGGGRGLAAIVLENRRIGRSAGTSLTRRDGIGSNSDITGDAKVGFVDRTEGIREIRWAMELRINRGPEILIGTPAGVSLRVPDRNSLSRMTKLSFKSGLRPTTLDTGKSARSGYEPFYNTYNDTGARQKPQYAP